MDTKDMLLENVRSIAEEISNGFPEYTNHDDEQMSAMDYIAEALDVTYYIGANGEFRGGEIAVTIGGPNVYVNVGKRLVEGYWGGEQAVASYRDDVGLYEAMEELYEITK